MEDQVNKSMESTSMEMERLNCFFNSSDLLTRLLELAYIIDRYYTPILCLLGALGNCLCILIFFNKSHNKARGSLSSSVYLSALAISDTGYLLNLFILWLDNIGFELLTNVIICPTVMYLGQVTGFLSVWFIVAFTIERCFAVCYPLSRTSRCTVSRARKITLGLTIFAITAFSYVCVIAQVVQIPSKPYVENSLFTSQEEMTARPNTSLSELSVDFGNGSSSSIQDGIRSGSSFSQNLEEISNISYTDQLQPQPLPNFRFNTTDRGGGVKHGKKNCTQEAVKSPKEPLYVCTVPDEYALMSQVFNYIDSIITFIIPFILIAVLNMKIIFCVKSFKSHRDSMLAHKISHRDRNGPNSRFRSLEKPKLKDYLTSNLKAKEKKSSRQTPAVNINSKVLSIEKLSSHRGVKFNAVCLKCQEVQRHHHQQKKLQSHKSEESPDRNLTQKKILTKVANKSTRNECLHNVGHFIESDSECSSSGQITPPFPPTAFHSPSTAFTEIRVTTTLLLVSSVFLLLHFPSHSIRVASFIESFNGGSKETLRKLNVANHWANFLFNTNFAVNFFLYCCSGKAFRHSVKTLLSWDKEQQTSPAKNTTTTVITQLTLNHSDLLVKKHVNIRGGGCQPKDALNLTWKRTQQEDQV